MERRCRRGGLKRAGQAHGRRTAGDRMISIYAFSDAFEPGFPPLLSLCNPGRTVSELVGNRGATMSAGSRSSADRSTKRWRN